MLSIIIPARNEEKRIGSTLKAYGRFFSNVDDKVEILIIVNNSNDKTVNIANIYSRKFSFIHYLDMVDPGKGLALVNGFRLAKGDYIGFVDADMSTNPEDFYELYKNIGKYDVIIGSRWLKNSKTERSFGKLLRSKGFNYLVRGLFFLPFKDTQCGAKIFRNKVIKEVVDEMSSMKWAFDVNLLYLLRKKGYRIKEHPTNWTDKEGSGISLKTPVQMAAGVIKLRLIYSPFKFVVRGYDLFPEFLKIHH